MTTRTLIAEDETVRTYEVYNDDGDVIGYDHEPVDPPEPEPLVVTIDPATVEQVKADLAKATTVTGVKNALGPLLDALS